MSAHGVDLRPAPRHAGLPGRARCWSSCAPGCRADAPECDTLYLVGDIVDGWQLRRSWYWPQAHNDVVQKLLRKARKGTRVVFVPATTTSSRALRRAQLRRRRGGRRLRCTPPPTAAGCGSSTATCSTA
jgi:hypothetical protein